MSARTIVVAVLALLAAAPPAAATLAGPAAPGTNTEYCTRCDGPAARYVTRAGMRRLARALVPRQRSDLTP